MKPKLIKVIAAFTAATAVAVGVSGCKSQELSIFEQYLANMQYGAAVDYFDENYDKLPTEQISGIFKNTADDIYSKYMSEELSEAAAKKALNDLCDIRISELSNYAEEVYDKFDKMSASRKSYEQGTNAFTNSNYYDAVRYFREVDNEYPGYQTAQKKLSEAEQKYLTDIKSEVDKQLAANDFSSAGRSIRTALNLIPDNAELTEKFNECNTLYKSYIKQQAKEKYADKKDYSGAINYIQNYINQFEDSSDLSALIDEYKIIMQDEAVEAALTDANKFIKNGDNYNAIIEIRKLKERYPDNKKLLDLEKKTIDNYIKGQLETMDKYISGKKYAEAYNVGKNALKLLDKNEEIQKRINDIEPHVPVMLSDMKISDYNRNFVQYTDINKVYEDTIGNRYDPGNLFSIWHRWLQDDGYAKVFLNSQYKNLTGTIAASDDTENGCAVKLTIYGDDKILYSYDFSRDTVPQKISINVSGVQWITFTVQNSGKSSHDSGILLSGLGFAKK